MRPDAIIYTGKGMRTLMKGEEKRAECAITPKLVRASSLLHLCFSRCTLHLDMVVADSRSLSKAVADLDDKTAAWSSILYGSMDYVICYAAAGAEFQLYAIRKGCRATPISQVYDLATCGPTDLHVLISYLATVLNVMCYRMCP